MDQQKIGLFLKTLRKEKAITQEQFAEKFNVSRRTVTRWETGVNMPDLDILAEIADFYELDLRELFDGERKSEKMNEEMKETVIKAAEYGNDQKEKLVKVTLVYFILGIISLIINQGMQFFDLPDTFWIGFVKGITAGLTLLSMIFGILYLTGAMNKVKEFKSRTVNKQFKDNKNAKR